MTADDFRAWMARHRYSVRGLGDALGLSARTIQRYRDGSLPVPRTVELALIGLLCTGHE